MSVYVPGDVIDQILVKLPPRAAVRCGATCKQLYSLINSSGFISKTLAYTLSTRNHSAQAFILSPSHNLSSTISLYLEPYSVDDYKPDIPYPFLTDRRDYCFLIDSIHGLVCFVIIHFDFQDLDPSEIYIWNPLIRRCIKIQRCSLIEIDSLLVCGFGFDCVRNDYKVVVIGCCRKRYSECNVQVYSLKQGVWRDIDWQGLNSSGTRLHRFADQHYLNGVIHWLAYGENDERLIVCFDVFHETFKALKLPCNDTHCSKLFQIREFLACYDDRHINASVSDIWVMKDYGVESSWTKIYSFESSLLSPSVLGFKDGAVLMVNSCFKRRNELFWFDLQNGVIMKTRIEVPTCFIRVTSYTESLILMDKESGAVSYEEVL